MPRKRFLVGDRLLALQRRDEAVHEAFGGEVQHLAVAVGVAGPGDRLQQMRLAEADAGMDVERIEHHEVAAARRRPPASRRHAISVLERPIMKVSKVSRGSSGEPPDASCAAETGARVVAVATLQLVRRSGLLDRDARARRFGLPARRRAASARTGTLIAAVRTVMSMRCTQCSSACQQRSTRSL